ncbi:TPA: DNA adenine methylase, partial [Mannheimia haemolytica]|nr:DNA adenine methylase [Mannheimia haemolytica]
VGHYDAYRKNVNFEKTLVLNVLLPEKNINSNNVCYNLDANELIKSIKGDLLYLDPPYNSRQYCDAYHLLENVARWEKPKVYGVARKMDRTSLKSDYCMIAATKAFEELIENADAKYILLSYNNMSDKGNDRSNAKISDEDIMKILSKKGKVIVFESDYKSFSTGKSDIQDNKERLFLCEVFSKEK